jgi:uncharacterized protein (TIGR03067 family)
MDMLITEGAEKGKTVHAIFKVDKDQLVICLKHLDAGKERPKEFVTKADSGLAMLTLERVKE